MNRINLLSCFLLSALFTLGTACADEAGKSAGTIGGTNTPWTIGGVNCPCVPISHLWRKSVYNTAGQPIGDLNDILVDKDGKIAALVVGVGGFLGLGEKNVAVDFDQLKQNGSISSDRIVLGITEQDLRNAPAFERK